MNKKHKGKKKNASKKQIDTKIEKMLECMAAHRLKNKK